MIRVCSVQKTKKPALMEHYNTYIDIVWLLKSSSVRRHEKELQRPEIDEMTIDVTLIKLYTTTIDDF